MFNVLAQVEWYCPSRCCIHYIPIPRNYGRSQHISILRFGDMNLRAFYAFRFDQIAKEKVTFMQSLVESRLKTIQDLAQNPDPEVIDALSSIDSIDSSGNIRSALEEKELETLNTFIRSFSGLSKTIDAMFKTIDALDRSCDSMLSKLSLGEKGVDEVLDMTSSLHMQQGKQKQQLAKINAFIDEYYLTKADFDILNNNDINDAFFDVFAKLEVAQEHTTEAMRSNQSQCLIDVSASLNKAKEAAYQRMYHWLHMNAHLFDSIHPSLGANYERCLKTIKEKPFLWGFVVDEIAKVRGDVVGRAFLKALTTGDSETKPIEASAEIDPLQYVGDLFAWIHQSSATECAFFANLLKEDQGSKAVKNAISGVYGSVVRPLEIRMTQAIKGLAKPTDIYQVANVCAFFANTFGQMCGLTSPIYKCCDSMKSAATDAFKNSISDSISDIRAGGKPTQGTITEAIRTVTQITSLHKQSSLSDSFDVGTLIDNYAAGLREAIQECNDSALFQADALYELSLVARDANLQCKATLSQEVDDLVKQIVATEVDDMYSRCRIKEIMLLAENKTGRPMSTVHGMEPDVLTPAIKRFEEVLLSPGPIVTQLCDRLHNAELRQKCRQLVADKLSASYELLFNIVMDPYNGYDSTGSMVRHMPNHIRDSILV